ncbi:hypothetical protein PUR61_12325 [Streptomyces sp. BE20]|uniref:hypothetical protein n=1 Tax=unclassified Streptomyces TaxID=2593676 RepID=UPI002E7A691D|nr:MULTISPECIES: hypothetical protein [unclassified Streptomyces]MED7948860.1 hypothetical protein [Streptomyces sp. BE303]MEE1822970.1 hypothetical protein [Streptomyces sp. BE20]
MAISDVEQLARDLASTGAVNLDTKIGDILKINGVGAIDNGAKVASGAVAWDGYVVVYKGLPAGLNELQNVSQPGALNA